MLKPETQNQQVRSGKMFAFVWWKEEAMFHWDEIEEMIESSIFHSYGTMTIEQTKEEVQKGTYVVIGTAIGDEVQFICLARIVDYPTYKVARVVAAAGKKLKESMNFIHVLEEWAFMQGAVELEGWCRPSMVKLLRRMNWKPKFTIVTYDIRRRLQ